jgi:hypothetical protein
MANAGLQGVTADHPGNARDLKGPLRPSYSMSDWRGVTAPGAQVAVERFGLSANPYLPRPLLTRRLARAHRRPHRVTSHSQPSAIVLIPNPRRMQPPDLSPTLHRQHILLPRPTNKSAQAHGKHHPT